MRVHHLVSSLLITVAIHGLLPAIAQGEVIVRMETNLGNIDVELYDDAAPVTVENFLNYVNSDKYDGTFIHRSVPGFIIQGGGYFINSDDLIDTIPKDPPIMNEFDLARSNLRGTITMAKVDGDPNSATSEWFFNLADNSANLDIQNGGFTVFGRVLRDGMDIVDAIGALATINCTSPFDQLPLIDLITCPTSSELQQHLVTINNIWQSPAIQGNQAILIDNVGNIASLTAVAPATLANVAVSDNPSPTNAPDDVTFQEGGFFSFQVDGITPGGSTMVAMQLPSGYVPNTYYMYGPTPDNRTNHWYEFKFDGRTGAEFFDNNYVVLNFIDGERGDADLTANGTIVDPGAPGISTVAASTDTSDGGGCTLSSHPRGTPIAVDFGVLLLALFARLMFRNTRNDGITNRC